MGKPLSYWIKERHNPQLEVYHVACGQLTKAKARATERTLHGFNVMLRFDTEKAYQAKLAALKMAGTLQPSLESINPN